MKLGSYSVLLRKRGQHICWNTYVFKKIPGEFRQWSNSERDTELFSVGYSAHWNGPSARSGRVVIFPRSELGVRRRGCHQKRLELREGTPSAWVEPLLLPLVVPGLCCRKDYCQRGHLSLNASQCLAQGWRLRTQWGSFWSTAPPSPSDSSSIQAGDTRLTCSYFLDNLNRMLFKIFWLLFLIF